MHVWFSSAQNWYFQQMNGVLSPEMADGQWVTMAIFNNTSPGFRDYWDTRSYLYTPAFRQFVESNVFSRRLDDPEISIRETPLPTVDS